MTTAALDVPIDTELRVRQHLRCPAVEQLVPITQTYPIDGRVMARPEVGAAR
jgi:hypothetical protein